MDAKRKQGSPLAAHPQLSRRDRKKQEVRERICSTALQAFLTHGPAHVTMQDIADLADVARSSVFNYFPTKMDLLGEIYFRFGKAILRDIQAQPAAGFRDGMAQLFRAISRHAAGLIPVLKEVAPLTLSGQALSSHDASVDEAMLAHLAELIALGVRKGELNAAIDAAELTGLLLALISVTNHEWIGRGGAEDLFSLHQQRFDLVYRGLAPDSLS